MKIFNKYFKVLILLLVIIFSKSAYADSKMKLGLNVFKNKGTCGTCHTLQAAESLGEIGPNLDKLKPQMNQMIFVITNGIGVMPAWEGILTYEEIDAVAYFIFNSTNK